MESARPAGALPVEDARRCAEEDARTDTQHVRARILRVAPQPRERFGGIFRDWVRAGHENNIQGPRGDGVVGGGVRGAQHSVGRERDVGRGACGRDVDDGDGGREGNGGRRERRHDGGKGGKVSVGHDVEGVDAGDIEELRAAGDEDADADGHGGMKGNEGMMR